jgi:competence protein ComFC
VFPLLTACEPNPILRRTVHAFKYTYNEELLVALGDLLVQRLVGIEFPPDTWIVPVPLHAGRLRERGFNQCLLLARHIASKGQGSSIKTTVLHVGDILQRIKITFPQAQLSKSDRLKNVSGAFSLKSNTYSIPKSVILLDDIVTTGSTIIECREVLYRAGVTQVYIMALSHGLS